MKGEKEKDLWLQTEIKTPICDGRRNKTLYV